MATARKPNKKIETTLVTEQLPATAKEETTSLQLVGFPVRIKNDIKAYTAKSQFKSMTAMVIAMFEEYKETHKL